MKIIELLPDRRAAIPHITLLSGSHSPDSKFCVMELSAWLANEPWSDHPQCVSPILGAFLRSWNDSLDDKARQHLKPYAERVINTAGDEAAEERRAWMATDWLVRVCAPAFLDLAKLHTEAQALRSLPVLKDSKTTNRVLPTIQQARGKSSAVWAAAWAAARAAARTAACDAAWAAARTAAWTAARTAAWTAACDAAWAAARTAACDAAWAAACDAAWDALTPTVKELQESAFQLLDRMIEAKSS